MAQLNNILKTMNSIATLAVPGYAPIGTGVGIALNLATGDPLKSIDDATVRSLENKAIKNQLYNFANPGGAPLAPPSFDTESFIAENIIPSYTGSSTVPSITSLAETPITTSGSSVTAKRDKTPMTLADTIKATNRLNLASTGIAAAGAIGSLINEANAKPLEFAPIVKENTISLDKSTSRMESAAKASADKTFQTGLTYLSDRGLNPLTAAAAMGSGRDKTLSETSVNLENIRRSLEATEANINAGIESRNVQGMNALNRFKEQVQTQANVQAGQNVGSAISLLSQLPSGYGDALMGSQMFKLNLGR